MNKQRRKGIINAIKAIQSAIELILQDEENAYENMPENLQGSYRGEESEEAQDNLQSAIDALEEAIGYLEDI